MKRQQAKGSKQAHGLNLAYALDGAGLASKDLDLLSRRNLLNAVHYCSFFGGQDRQSA
jgi:hypothetical protein